MVEYVLGSIIWSITCFVAGWATGLLWTTRGKEPVVLSGTSRGSRILAGVLITLALATVIQGRFIAWEQRESEECFRSALVERYALQLEDFQLIEDTLMRFREVTNDRQRAAVYTFYETERDQIKMERAMAPLPEIGELCR